MGKAQASLEYLLTYGWALILIATIIGVLVFVVMAPSSMLIFSSSDPTKIMLKGASGMDNKVEIVLQNITGGDIEVNKITLTATFTGGTANGQNIVSGVDIYPSIHVPAGGLIHIEDVDYGGGTVGGRISIDYTDFAGLHRSVDIEGGGSDGGTGSGEVSQPPTQPTLIDEPDGQSEGTVLLEWNASTDPESDTITYNLIIGTSTGTSDVLDDDTQNLDYTSPSLTAGTYYWSVMACDDGSNCSARSAEDNFTIISSPPPDGSPGSPFEIGDCAELQEIDNDLTAYYILTSDVDCSGFSFDPIGDSGGANFSGSLNGQGHSVINLSVGSVGVDYAGLFVQVLAGGEVKDITLTNVAAVGRMYVGALAGKNYGIITNASSSGTITPKLEGGGLVGSNFGTIQNSSSSANIFPSPSGNNMIGGLVGINYDAIIESFSTGTINPSANGSAFGGLVGSNWPSGTIDRSYSTSTVNPAQDIAGGLVGNNYGLINDCYATGTVTGVDKIGGFIGDQADETITNSYSIGVVIESGSVFGGFAGDGSSCNDSFWDTETSEEAASACGATGKTTTEMQTASTFTDAGWDTGTWNLVNDSYPSLQWE